MANINKIIKEMILLVLMLNTYLCADGTTFETGMPSSKLSQINELMVRFMRDNEAPGAALCIAKDGTIIYNKGFGYANIETKEPVKRESQFRIGSISKPITAATVMVLAEKGILKLDEKVFSIINYEPFTEADASADPRIYDITILNLLQHRGGWDLSKTFDPTSRLFSIGEAMKLGRYAEGQDLIRYMMGKPLQYKPGTRYCYSNFGYLLLGVIIEKKANMPYAEAVNKYVFEPLKLENIVPGGAQLEDRMPKEVVYYDSEKRTAKRKMPDGKIKEFPYPYYQPFIRETTAVGGWISNAEDLVNFALALKAPYECRILSHEYVKKMFAIPQQDKQPMNEDGEDGGDTIQKYSYSCGWKVKETSKGKFIIWHHGSRPGASAGLCLNSNGYTYA
ncbi:MAG: hypothetical protein CVV39_08635, partial [Planctomycetes bacterium HGW-Planctomycetes-1]